MRGSDRRSVGPLVRWSVTLELKSGKTPLPTRPHLVAVYPALLALCVPGCLPFCLSPCPPYCPHTRSHLCLLNAQSDVVKRRGTFIFLQIKTNFHGSLFASAPLYCHLHQPLPHVTTSSRCMEETRNLGSCRYVLRNTCKS